MILAKILGSIKAKLYDSSGNAIDSEVVGSQRAIVVKDVGGGTSAEDDKILEIYGRPPLDAEGNQKVVVKNSSTEAIPITADNITVDIRKSNNTSIGYSLYAPIVAMWADHIV